MNARLNPLLTDPLIDTNVYLSRWPCRRLPLDETRQLVAHCQRAGIGQAWAASFDGLLHRDLSEVNRRVAAECREHPELLVPVGTIDPTLPDWEGDLRACVEEHAMAVVRLHPAYHGYGLDDARVKELLRRAAEHRLIVQITVKLEDERTQHPLLRVPPVDLKPLLAYDSLPPVMLLNALRDLRGSLLGEFAEKPPVSLEIATLEGVAGIQKLTREFPFERIMFGSYSPFFYLEAAVLKLRESPLAGRIRAAVARENAQTLLSTRRAPQNKE